MKDLKVSKTKPKAAPFRPETRADFIAHPEWALILRTCDANRLAHGGFEWPESGPVECSDWRATVACGNGLHGLLWGEGDGGLVNWAKSAKWLVVLVKRADVIEIDAQKCKFPRGEVVFCGDRFGAVTYMQDRRPDVSRGGVSGTATARAWMVTDWMVRVHTPAWLRLAGLEDQATALEVLPALAVKKLEPTKLSLQRSVLQLLDRMIEAGK